MSYPTINSLNKAFGAHNIQFLDGNYDYPYIQQGEDYLYFAPKTQEYLPTMKLNVGKDYVLIMTSTKDLGRKDK